MSNCLIVLDSELCSADSCKNGGVCIQTWPSVSCQCEMTSFTGSQCSDGMYCSMPDDMSVLFYVVHCCRQVAISYIVYIFTKVAQ